MANEKHETIADIAAAMRDYSNACNDGYLTEYSVVCTDMRNYADRIEAAAMFERELSKIATKNGVDSGQFCDAAKLREALEDSQSLLESFSWGEYGGQVREQMRDNRAALAAPLRNCDVGTAEEQNKRFEKFCQAHHEYWKPSKSLTAIQKCNCPCREGNSCNYFIWAQMPYEEGGEK